MELIEKSDGPSNLESTKFRIPMRKKFASVSTNVIFTLHRLIHKTPLYELGNSKETYAFSSTPDPNMPIMEPMIEAATISVTTFHANPVSKKENNKILKIF